MAEVLTLHNESMDLVLAPGESRHLVLMSPENVTLHVKQQEGSSFMLHVLSPLSQVHVTVEQNAPSCRTALYGMAIVLDKQEVDVETHVLHNVGGGYSEQLFKNVLKDESRCSFYGELKVLPDAQKTEAYQTNRNIILSDMARVATRPQLEIYADDVKCSHGATTGQLDEKALFYMRQRGICLQEAQRMLLQAFLEDVLTGIEDESLLEQVRQQIAERL